MNEASCKCPNCGYCQHCGRSDRQAQPWYPVQPWYPTGPIWIVPFVQTTGTPMPDTTTTTCSTYKWNHNEQITYTVSN